MKKILFLALLIVGSVFGNTIVIQTERLREGGNIDIYEMEIEGEYLGIVNDIAYLRLPNGELQEIKCENLIVIFNNDRVPIPWDCNANSFTPRELTELDIKKIKKNPVIGGTLIAIGGAILISQNEKDFEDRVNDSNYQSTSTIAYALIAIGGVLVALGI